jgi:hypothetical protein
VTRPAKTVREAREQARAHPLVAAILDADDLPFKDVEIPEWGGVEIRIRGADGRTLERWQRQQRITMLGDSGKGQLTLADNQMAEFVAQCLFDPATNEPLPITAEDLSRKSGRVLSRIYALAMILSGQGPKAVEEAEGNSEADQSGSSTTD